MRNTLILKEYEHCKEKKHSYNSRITSYNVCYTKLLRIAFRFIYTDLTSNAIEETKPGVSFAADLGIYYENDLNLGGKDAKYALGASITNMGTPVSYSEEATKTPIPTNLRMGGRLDYRNNFV